MNKRVLTIHLLEGTATGLQTAEIDNWIGKIFVAPKSELPTLLKHQEIKDALGVYVLVGDDPNQTGKSIIYVGQGKIKNRLTLHSNSNYVDYWDNKTLVLVAKDDTLNTAVCLYLESCLIELANKSSSTPFVKNLTSPPLPFLSATDRTHAENFLNQVLTLLPSLNIDYFVQPPVTTPTTNINNAPTVTVPALVSSPRFTYVSTTGTAEAELINSQFVVLKNSLANPNETPSIGLSNKNLRSQLKSNGSLADDSASGKWIFTKNVAFNSPSAAVGVISGASIAGPTAWKVQGTAQTYGEWLQNQVNAVAPPTTGPAPTAGTTP